MGIKTYMPDEYKVRDLQTAKPSAGLYANGFALLPIEAGTISEAWPFYVSADARKEEDAQPDHRRISRVWLRSSGVKRFCTGCGFLNSIICMQFSSYAFRLNGAMATCTMRLPQ
jgi:hypothetical protein